VTEFISIARVEAIDMVKRLQRAVDALVMGTNAEPDTEMMLKAARELVLDRQQLEQWLVEDERQRLERIREAP